MGQVLQSNISTEKNRLRKDGCREMQEIAMKHKVRVQVPVVRRGLFGRKKIVYEERTVVVDGRTYRHMKNEQRNRETDDLLGFIDEMETFDAIFDD